MGTAAAEERSDDPEVGVRVDLGAMMSAMGVVRTGESKPASHSSLGGNRRGGCGVEEGRGEEIGWEETEEWERCVRVDVLSAEEEEGE